MHTEEVTFSEELMKESTWKEWIKDNRLFLGVIGILSLLSLALLIENQWNGPSTEKIISALKICSLLNHNFFAVAFKHYNSFFIRS